jgi:hypothetical protein
MSRAGTARQSEPGFHRVGSIVLLAEQGNRQRSETKRDQQGHDIADVVDDRFQSLTSFPTSNQVVRYSQHPNGNHANI